jgi:hypothetical protein
MRPKGLDIEFISVRTGHYSEPLESKPQIYTLFLKKSVLILSF